MADGHEHRDSVESSSSDKSFDPHDFGHIGTPKEKAQWLRNKKLVEKLRRNEVDVDALLGKKEDLPPLSCRQKMLEMLEKPIAQLLLALLMIVDSAIIVAEIVVEVKEFVAEVHIKELEIEHISNWIINFVSPIGSLWHGPRLSKIVGEEITKFIQLLNHVAENVNTTVCLVKEAEPLTNENSSSYKYEKWLKKNEHNLAEAEEELEKYKMGVEVLAITSIVVLALFVIEVTAKFIAMGPKKFLCSKLEVFDALIIYASFSVDLATYLSENPSPEATVMIILLIWRIVRLINGFLMHEKQTAESHNHIMHKLHQLMIYEVKYLKLTNEVDLEKLDGYRELCTIYNIPLEEMQQIEEEHKLTVDDLREIRKIEPHRRKSLTSRLSSLFRIHHSSENKATASASAHSEPRAEQGRVEFTLES